MSHAPSISHPPGDHEDAARIEHGGVTAAFLFTDIEDSSAKWLNHRAAMTTSLAVHDKLVRHAIEFHNGEVFKTGGDSFFATFGKISDAVDAAMEAQKRMAAHDWSAVDGLKVRMAVHVGTADRRDRDYFGPALNRCARLLALGHGGQILLTESTVEFLNAERNLREGLKPLGSYPLDDVRHPVGVYQVVVDGLKQDFPPLRTPEARPTNLPSRLARLIGRKAALEAARQLLADNRLVTLVGPGGVGKTRLALDLAHEQLPRFRGGVWLVECAPLSDAAHIPSAIAAALGIELRSTKPLLERLIDQLKSKEALIVLDNCEHLIADVAEIVEALLSNAAAIHVLATSQQPIGITGEQLFHVPPLSLPERAVSTAEGALKFGAVELFVERAHAADPTFVFDATAATAVADICKRLDGLPLAIEMAAARAPTLGLDELSKGLDKRFRMLAGAARTAPLRHRTLQATFDWSYDLLPERECRILRRVAVFSGGFSLDAAKAVASDASEAPDEVVDDLASLAAKSLVSVRSVEGRVRYGLLETTRLFALEKLAACGEASAMQERHARYFRAYFGDGIEDIFSMPSSAWYSAFAPEVDNLRAALRWSFSDEGDAECGITLAATSFAVWWALALLAEMRQWLERAMGKLSAATAPSVQALLWRITGTLLLIRAPTQATFMLERAAALYRDQRDIPGLVRSLCNLSYVQVSIGRLGAAEAALQEAKSHFERVTGRQDFFAYYSSLGYLNAFRNEGAEAVKNFNAAIEIARTVGHEWHLTVAQLDLARAHWILSDSARCEHLIRDVLGWNDHPSFRWQSLLDLGRGSLAAVLIERDQLQEARDLLQRAMPVLREMAPARYVFDHFALRLAKVGSHRSAARLAGAASALAAGYDSFRAQPEARAYAATLAILQEHSSAEEIERWTAEGRALSEAEAFNLVLDG
jgi:predicted ATPase/class 3 adenylate cyclase